MAGEPSDHTVVVKWSGEEYKLIIEKDGTVTDLKKAIQDATGVLPERQKLLGLKFKGKPPGDDVALTNLKLKPSTKIMMMGTREEELDKVKEVPKDLPEVVNDFDIEEEEIAIENREEYLSKIDRRIKEYEITVLNEPREGKKLLVLDIDYTLFDHRSVAETANELMRPFLHEFLQSAYENYDIVIWSATGMKWIEVKMRELGVTSNTNYKICFMLDHLAMISIHTPKYGVIEVKPLGVIWGKYEQWSSKNTIMFDDIRRNFIMNPQTGLRKFERVTWISQAPIDTLDSTGEKILNYLSRKNDKDTIQAMIPETRMGPYYYSEVLRKKMATAQIRAFREAHFNREKDKELLKLSKYLKDIAALDDFTNLNHRHWERYRPKRKHENVERLERKPDEKSGDT